MRTVSLKLDEVKQKVARLVGRELDFCVNHGRNKIENFRGAVENVYPAVFTVKEDEGNIKTFSYNDILTRNIRFIARGKA